ncbi:MAG TPA: L-rhamnose/proton symporter RhaT [Bryobacteraceae bacterium]|jgi:L-rhamnose-H+ transport protein|nr:L-rhamnose/proton symporter RhaT [Bryobacteraceae bacterium]
MILTGIVLAVLSGLCNGLFSAPMRLEKTWKWENIWLAFIVVACLLMPAVIVFSSTPDWKTILASSPRGSITSAVLFGFAWGFGAICFGLSVERLGVSIANSVIIGLSSALGSIVPLLTSGDFRWNAQIVLLLCGVAVFLVGVALCGRAGRIRDQASGRALPSGYLFALVSGIMSGVFNIGYSLALPIADTGVHLGRSRFQSTNCIWLLMLGAGAIPNVGYCLYLMQRNRTGWLSLSYAPMSWLRGISMGVLWGGSIFLYGAATPLLGNIGPSIGWPLSLAVGLLVANLMGMLLGEWGKASHAAIRSMNAGIVSLMLAIIICAVSTRVAP